MIRFAGITEIFRLIFRQCSTTSPDIYLVADVLDQSASIWSSSVTWTTASAIQYLIYAVSTRLHDAWQRTLRNSPFLDRLHPIGFSRGGV